MASGFKADSTAGRKLVVLGIPWEVDTDGLRSYMDQFGLIDDVIVMKDRATGKSRGFGYVTFASTSDAERAVNQVHRLKDRRLEVKLATPKEEMKSAKGQGTTRIFVARVPHSVTEEGFRSYFTKYGSITDSYMPKDPATKTHRGIGFVTFESPASVDRVMNGKHELDGASIAVDRATPKEETGKPWGRGNGESLAPSPQFHGYLDTRAPMSYTPLHQTSLEAYRRPASQNRGGVDGGLGVLRSLPPVSNPVSLALSSGATLYPSALGLGSGGSMDPLSSGRLETLTRPENLTKVFIGKLPSEATVEDLREYFTRFGPIEDIYIPKDVNKAAHRGFGFVTFVEEAVASFVSGRPHAICGRAVVVDRATPQEAGPWGGRGSGRSSLSYGESGTGGPIRGAGSSVGGLAGVFSGGSSAYTSSLGYKSYFGSLETPLEIAAPLYHSSRAETYRYRPY